MESAGAAPAACGATTSVSTGIAALAGGCGASGAGERAGTGLPGTSTSVSVGIEDESASVTEHSVDGCG